MGFTPDRIAVQLAPPAVRAVKQGHPWVYDRGVARQNRDGAAGDLAVLFDGKRRFLGLGLYDPESPLRVRVLHQGAPLPINGDWLRSRFLAAFDKRSGLKEDPATTGYRLVHGENDGLPGLVLDCYAGTLVLKLDTVAWAPHLPVLQDLLQALLAPDRIVLRLSRSVTSSRALPPKLTDGCVLRGPSLDSPVVFLENGIRFEADPAAGQKTGFFLDQRDNRAKVGELAAGRQVLNVFAYTGGFSLYAARGGAVKVVSLDLSAPALAAAERNFALNRDCREITRCIHETLRGDAFVELPNLAVTGQRFGLVVLDPPSFARKQEDVKNAVAAYERLTRLGLDVLEHDGILVASSCSARVPASIFFQAVQRSARRAGRSLNVLARTFHAVDHPIGFPEGAYLKCLFASIR